MAQSLLYICSVNNVAFSNCDFTESNYLTANKRHGKDMEGRYCGLTQGTNQVFSGRDRGRQQSEQYVLVEIRTRHSPNTSQGATA